MTKQIRIENADNSEHKVVVEVWLNGKKENELPLNNPADMITEYVHDSQYLIVKEI